MSVCLYSERERRNSNGRNKTKQSVTQQKSNWKPWQIVLVILLGLCALPVVVPVGLGLLRCSRHCSSTGCLRARSVGLQRSLRHRNDPCAGSTASGRTVFIGTGIVSDVSCGWQRLCDSGQRLYDDRISNPGHSIADRTGVADLERNFMDPQQGWRKEKKPAAQSRNLRQRPANR